MAGTRRASTWRRAARVAVVGVLAGAAVGLAGSPGLAATGRISISSPTGPNVTLLNPPAGCHNIQASLPAGTVVRNQTDATIVVYPALGCSGLPSVVLPPGGSTAFSPRSVDVLS
ncbi:hypothetical protein ACN27G_36205 [Plantactinospora sp. WMMB334]|uniref:hypothetical protein n=1 Tax=Plantactinospora sp. WMMB334 TaxID=3404119 RepID=UPI003B95983F